MGATVPRSINASVPGDQVLKTFSSFSRLFHKMFYLLFCLIFSFMNNKQHLFLSLKKKKKKKKKQKKKKKEKKRG